MFTRGDPLIFEGEGFLYFARASQDFHHIIRKEIFNRHQMLKYRRHSHFLTSDDSYVYFVVHQESMLSPSLANNRSASYLLEKEE